MNGGDGACRETQVSQQIQCARSELECLESQVEQIHLALMQVVMPEQPTLEKAEVEPPLQELVPTADSIRDICMRIQRQTARLDLLRGRLEV